MATYTYKTDAISGTLEADTLQQAMDLLDTQENISDCLDDGAWAIVEDSDGNRLHLGEE